MYSVLSVVCIVATISGSSSISLTEVLGWFCDKTFSSVAVDNGVIDPNKLYSFSRSIGFEMNVGINTWIFGGSFWNSLILELYSIIGDISFDFSVFFKVKGSSDEGPKLFGLGKQQIYIND